MRLVHAAGLARLGWGTGLGLVVAGLAGRNGVAVTVGLVLVVAAGLHRQLPMRGGVPVAAMIVLLLAAATGVGAHWLNWPAMSNRPGALAWVLAVTAAGTVAALVQSPSRPAHRPTRADPLAAVPAALATAVAVLHTVAPRTALAWVAGSTDGVQHALFIKQLRVGGMLDYSANGYPRAVHMLAAINGNAAGSPMTGESHLHAVGALTLWGLALMLWCLGSAALSLGALRGGKVGVAVLIVLTMLAVNPNLLNQLVLLAAVTTLPAAAFTVVPLIGRGSWAPAQTTPVLCLLALVTAASIQLWTPVAAIPAAMGLAVVARALLRPTQACLPGRPGLLVVALTIPLTVVATLPALVGLISRGGVTVAATPGQAASPDWLMCVLAAPSVLLLMRPSRCRAWPLLAGGAAGAVLAYLVVLIGSGDPTDPHQWYPVKMAWLVLLFLTPAAVVGWVRVLGRLGTWVRPVYRRAKHISTVIPVAGVLTALAAVFAMSPQIPLRPLVLTAFLDVRDYRTAPITEVPGSVRVLTLARQALEEQRVVVPIMVQPKVTQTTESWVLSRIISLDTGQTVNYGRIERACADVRRVAGDPARALVITALPAPYMIDALERQGCHRTAVRQTGAPIDTEGLSDWLSEYGSLPEGHAP